MTTHQTLLSRVATVPRVRTSLTYDHLPRLDIIQEISPQVAASLTCGDLPQFIMAKERAPGVVVAVTYEHLPRVAGALREEKEEEKDNDDEEDAMHRQLSPSTAGELTLDDLPRLGCEVREQEVRESMPASPAAPNDALQADHSGAPLWSDGPGASAGRYVHRAPATGPQEALAALEAFLRGDSLPCDLHSAPGAWTLTGIAFMDFVAVGFSASVFADGRGGSVTALSRAGGCDVVLFAHLTEQVLNALAGRAAESLPRLLQMDIDFEDEDEPQDDLSSWDVRLLCVLEGAQAGRVALREGWSTLALWGSHSAESRPHLARALCSEQGLAMVAGALRDEPPASAGELYPLAAALKFASLAAGAAGPSADGLLPLLRPAEGLPGLVARELEEAARNFAAL